MSLIELTVIKDGLFRDKGKYRMSVKAAFVASACEKDEGLTLVGFERKVMNAYGVPVDSVTVAEDVATVTAKVNAALNPNFNR